MDFYDMIMSPLEGSLLKKMRLEIMPQAEGDVLEVGIGTGANGPFYRYERIRSLTGLDWKYSPELEKHYPPEKFKFVSADIEQIPFANDTFDSVVATLILCTVDIEKSLNEVMRVLKPGGNFIFIEHVRPVGLLAGKAFDAFNTVWPKLANGCNLNRQTSKALFQSGFADISYQQKLGGIFLYGTATKPIDATGGDRQN